MKKCNETIPSELHRAIRPLTCLKYWKALEFRNFLLYFGFVVLKDILPQEVFSHFLLLVAATRIISSVENILEKFLHVAETFIDAYLEGFIEIYGINSVTSNVHNLSHVIEDVRRFGTLPSFSTYPFENALHHMKLLIRNRNQPFSQIAKRVAEIDSYDFTEEKPNITFPIIHKNKQKISVNEDITLSNNKRDKYFLTSDKQIVAMEKVVEINNNVYIVGQSMKTSYDFFETPFKSSYLDIYLCDKETNIATIYPIDCIKSKMVSVSYREQIVFSPLLHTYAREE